PTTGGLWGDWEDRGAARVSDMRPVTRRPWSPATRGGAAPPAPPRNTVAAPETWRRRAGTSGRRDRVPVRPGRRADRHRERAHPGVEGDVRRVPAGPGRPHRR